MGIWAAPGFLLTVDTLRLFLKDCIKGQAPCASACAWAWQNFRSRGVR